jgi:hypothetical protein
MSEAKDLGFSYRVRGSGEVVVLRGSSVVTTLRGAAAERFLRDVEAKDPQQVMARATGQYRRGNERGARSHPRNG